MATKKQRKSYSQTYKKRAVELALSSGNTTSHVARELGIAPKTLLGWMRDRTLNGGRGAEDCGAATRSSEIEILRAKVAELEKESNILRTAVAYFSNRGQMEHRNK